MAARETIARAFPCDARDRVAVASIQRMVQRTASFRRVPAIWHRRMDNRISCQPDSGTEAVLKLEQPTVHGTKLRGDVLNGSIQENCQGLTNLGLTRE